MDVDKFGDSRSEIVDMVDMVEMKRRSCIACRTTKVKCEKELDTTQCRRCFKKGIECREAPKKERKSGDLINRMGKRINKAKMIYGARQEESESTVVAVITPAEERVQLVEFRGTIVMSFLEAALDDRYRPTIIEQQVAFEFHNMGKKLENISPPSQVLCSIIVYNTARISDHPICVGPGVSRKKQILHYSPQSSLASFGFKRERVCRQFAEKAMALADSHGVLRVPHSTNIMSLYLLHRSQAWDSKYTPYLWALIQQSRQLMISNDAAGAEWQEMLKATWPFVCWLPYFQDSVYAFLHGREPFYDEDDLARLRNGRSTSLSAMLSIGGLDKVPVTKYFFALWDQFSITLRDAARTLTSKKARKASIINEISIVKFITDFRSIFIAIDEGPEIADVLLRKDFFTFTLALYAPLLLFTEILQSRIELSVEILNKAGGFFTSKQIQEELVYQERLNEYHQEANKFLFKAVREIAKACKVMISMGSIVPSYGFLVGGAEHLLSSIPQWLSVFLDTPPAEAGGPVDFPIKVKAEELQFIETVVYQLSWSHACPEENISWLKTAAETFRI